MDVRVISLVEALLQLSMIIMVGIYFIFSNTVMRALSMREDGAGVMVEINRQILNPFFLGCFGLSALAGMYFFYFHSAFQSLAGVVFTVGTTLVTVVFNVPLNNRLKQASNSDAAPIWRIYLAKWVFWNHVRTASALVSGLLLSL